MSTPSVLNTSKTALGDFVTGAQYDQSGLVSSLHEYLHGVGHEAFKTRATECGLQDTVERWATTDETEVATPESVQLLLPEDAINKLGHETGLSHNAVVTMLREVLPKAVRRMRKRDEAVL